MALDNNHSNNKYELRKLIDAMCEGTITAEQLAQLEARLEGDESARRIYLHRLAIHGALVARYRGYDRREAQQLLTEDSGEAGVFSTITRKKPRQKSFGATRLFFRPLWAIAAAVLIALGAFLWLRSNPDDPNQDIAQPTPEQVKPQNVPADDVPADDVPLKKPAISTPTETFATLHTTGAVRWSDTGKPVESGARIGADQSVDIVDGECEAVLNDGVRVVVEGPAKWKLESQNKFALDSGKVYVDGPPDHSGFTVRTPNAEIVDLGTEFVVDASADKNTDVAVLSGLVDCVAFSENDSILDRTQIVAGEAARMASGKKTRVMQKAPEEIQRRQRLKMPAAVRARWRFEESVPPPPNAELTPIRGAISDSSGHGHRLDYWPGGKEGIGNYAFSKDVPPTSMFREGESGGFRSFDPGSLHPSKPGVLQSPTGCGQPELIENGFTLEGFFKTDGDRFRSGNMVILFQGEKYNSYMVALNTQRNGECRFGVFGTDRSGGKPGFISAMTPERANFTDGRWYYFAARYTSAQEETPGRVELIVVDEEGRQYSNETETPKGFKVATSNRPLLVGRYLYLDELESKSHFVGLIDEVRISNRPLRDGELLGRFSPEKLETAKNETTKQEAL